MEFVDVHCHLDHERYNDLDEVIERAKKIGVKYIITSGVNPSTNRKALEIMKKYSDMVKVSFGIYPMDALANEIKEIGENAGMLREIENFNLDKEIEWIEKNKDKCVAIGECGMDFSYEVLEKNKQEETFSKVIELAKKIDKPLVIHSRKAEKECIDLLEKHNAKKVVMHCFGGRKSLIKRAQELGFYFSIPAVITRLQHFETLVSIVPLEQLLTETDGPYLAPVAGERSEPAHVVITIKEIAKIKNLPEEKVAEQIFENAKNIFGF